MARFLKHIAAFALFALPLYLLLLLAWGSWVPQPYLKNLFPRPDTRSFLRERIVEIPAYKGADVLVLGPSLSQRGIDPRVFARHGYRLFQLSSGGQGAPQSLQLLRRYLDSVRPKRVLLCVFPEFYAGEHVESNLDLLFSDRIGFDNVREVGRQLNLRQWNTLAYLLLRRAGGSPLRPLRFENASDRYVSGGFLEQKRTAANTSLQQPCASGPQWPFDPHQLLSLDSALALLRRHGIPVALVQPPLSTPAWHCQQYGRQVDSLFARKGRYYNFNGKVALDDGSDFSDRVHLTPAGAAKFSEALLRQLESDGFLGHATEPSRQ